MKGVIGFILVILFFVNSIVIGALYPNEASDYYQFVDAYNLRRKVYECMFCLFFYICMFREKGITRAVFAFGFIVSAASCIDKIFLHIDHYLVSDLLVVAIGLVIAYYVYKKTRNVQFVE